MLLLPIWSYPSDHNRNVVAVFLPSKPTELADGFGEGSRSSRVHPNSYRWVLRSQKGIRLLFFNIDYPNANDQRIHYQISGKKPEKV